MERSIIMGMCVIEISEDDCHTNTYLKTNIISQKHIDTLIGKYYKLKETDEEWKLLESGEDLVIGQEIFLRSPIYCTTPDRKICQKCWGEKKFNTKYLGILAGQILSERFVKRRFR
jgi:hypothetical protein